MSIYIFLKCLQDSNCPWVPPNSCQICNPLLLVLSCVRNLASDANTVEKEGYRRYLGATFTFRSLGWENDGSPMKALSIRSFKTLYYIPQECHNHPGLSGRFVIAVRQKCSLISV